MASKRRLRRKQCGNKIQYSTLADAQFHAKRLSWIKHEWLHAYKCEFGQHYHVGHPNKQHKRIMSSL